MIKNGQTITDTDFVINLIAGENLTVRDAVFISTSDGKAYQCDADSTSEIGFIGFAQETVTTGNTVNIVISGIMTGFSALTIGGIYYVSGTAGAITTTAPTNKKIVGTAISATTIKIAEFQTVKTNVFTGSGTWTKLPGLKYVLAEVVGGGGGGGNGVNGSPDLGGGGGGAGGYSRKMILVADLGATETVTVGAATGTSSFGSHCQATGGSNGSNANGGNNVAAGGSAGVGSGGDINISGQSGGSVHNSSTLSAGATGGSSYFGGGGKGGASDSAGEGSGNYGGGGGGGSGSGTGGAGAGGIVVVTDYY